MSAAIYLILLVFRLALQRNENEREHFMRKVELAESEAAKRMKEVDAKEAERIEAHNQFKRILAMVEERVSCLVLSISLLICSSQIGLWSLASL